MTLMKKKLNKKGFTLAELLIVVAIIAVLAAIAIPVFSGQLTKAKLAADKANVRAWYAECTALYLTDEKVTNVSTDTAVESLKISGATVELKVGSIKYVSNSIVYSPDTGSDTLTLAASGAFAGVTGATDPATPGSGTP